MFGMMSLPRYRAMLAAIVMLAAIAIGQVYHLSGGNIAHCAPAQGKEEEKTEPPVHAFRDPSPSDMIEALKVFPTGCNPVLTVDLSAGLSEVAIYNALAKALGRSDSIAWQAIDSLPVALGLGRVFRLLAELDRTLVSKGHPHLVVVLEGGHEHPNLQKYFFTPTNVDYHIIWSIPGSLGERLARLVVSPSYPRDPGFTGIGTVIGILNQIADFGGLQPEDWIIKKHGRGFQLTREFTACENVIRQCLSRWQFSRVEDEYWMRWIR